MTMTPGEAIKILTTQRLVFGDPVQIEAVQALSVIEEAQAEAEEARAAALAADEDICDYCGYPEGFCDCGNEDWEW
jgi:hypothetical protein